MPIARRVRCCILVCPVLASTLLFARADTNLPANPPYFPCDERLIEDRWQLDRFTVPLQRHPKNPILVKDRDWEGTGPHAGGTVLRDPVDGLFKMWYSVWNQEAYENRRPFSYNVCYAESADGLAWRKPALNLFDFHGSRSNNVIKLGRNKTQNVDVELHPSPADAHERFVAIHNDRGGVFVSTSGDGKTFTNSLPSPAVSYHSDTHNNFVYDEVRRRWLMFVRPKAYAAEGLKDAGRRRVAVKESRDLKLWTEERTVLTPEEGDADHFYGMTVFRRGDLFFGGLEIYETAQHHLDVELAWSGDGYQWRRQLRGPRVPLLAVGPRGTWDAGMAFLMEKPVEVGEELWFYYGGSDTAHNVPGRMAVGLATTKRDRLIGVRSRPGHTGRLLTRPVRVAGHLFLNVQATGSIRVSVHTPKDDPLSHWTVEDCTPVTGDHLNAEVRWKGRHLSALKGETVRLRFHFQDAALFAFTF